MIRHVTRNTTLRTFAYSGCLLAAQACAFFQLTPTTVAKAPAPTVAPPVERRPEPIVHPPQVEPPAEASDSLRVARLVRVAALWDAIRLFHPAVTAGNVPWDEITARRLVAIRGAQSRDAYATELRAWLATLGDPNTRVEPDGERTNAAGSASAAQISRTADSILIVTLPALELPPDGDGEFNLSAMVRTLSAAHRVVLDIRAADTAFVSGTIANAQTGLQLAEALASRPAAGPSTRHRVHEGFSREDSTGSALSTNFRSSWRVVDGVNVVPRTPSNASSRQRRIVIVANRGSAIPAPLLALVSSQQAMLVAEEGLRDETLVVSRLVPMGEGLTVRVRHTELLNADGTLGINADTSVTMLRAPSPPDSAPALKAALAFIRAPLFASRKRASWPAGTQYESSVDFPTNSHYPGMGERLLAVFRLWGTIRSFHAYRELYDEDLDLAFTRIVPRVEAARDAFQYATVVADLAAVMDDAQSEVSGPSYNALIGAASAPFRARWIEGRAIITQRLGEATGGAPGIAVGDEIVSADGFPMHAYVGEHRRLSASSNEWTRLRNIMNMLPRGPVGDASYRIRNASGREVAVTLSRNETNRTALPETERSHTPVWREMSGRIGYVDASRLLTSQIDSVFQSLRTTRALIVDLRGTLRASRHALLAKVATHPRTTVARMSLRITTEPCLPTNTAAVNCPVERRQFDEILTADTSQRYRGRMVMLVDERTQGEAELLGLGFESVAASVIVGSPGAGASGEVTVVSLPGQLRVTMSGLDARRTDGRQVQRVGLTPHIDARPTVKGVRAAQDEVLDRAHSWLLQQLDPPPVRRRP